MAAPAWAHYDSCFSVFHWTPKFCATAKTQKKIGAYFSAHKQKLNRLSPNYLSGLFISMLLLDLQELVILVSKCSPEKFWFNFMFFYYICISFFILMSCLLLFLQFYLFYKLKKLTQSLWLCSVVTWVALRVSVIRRWQLKNNNRSLHTLRCIIPQYTKEVVDF